MDVSKDCKNVTKYFNAVYKHLIGNNIFEKIHKLMSYNESYYLELEQIDCEITQACEHGEKTVVKEDAWRIGALTYMLQKEVYLSG